MPKSAPARKGKIKFGGVFNCRTVAGSTTFSQHAWGNAVDIFCDEDDLQAIAKMSCCRRRNRPRRTMD
jgi:hypothetical protein